MASLRTKIVVRKLSEVIRNSKGRKTVCMGKILREAGYSRQTSLKPKLVTETKGYKEEFAKLIPDLTLVGKHVELLHACKLKTFSIDKRLSDREIMKIINGLPNSKVRNIVRNKHSCNAVCYYWTPDNMTILSALDLSYKIKGYYHLNKQQASDIPVVVKIVNYKDTIKTNLA